MENHLTEVSVAMLTKVRIWSVVIRVVEFSRGGIKLVLSSAPVAQLGRVPDDLDCLVVGSIPGRDLCERNTFGRAQKTQ